MADISKGELHITHCDLAEAVVSNAELTIRIYPREVMTLEELEANAHLITAAPDNYETNSETLRIFRDLRDNHEALWSHIIEEYPDIVNHWDKIKKALAKAEGREKK